MTLNAWIAETKNLFIEQGVSDTPGLDARLLLGHATGYDQGRQIVNAGEELAIHQLDLLENLRSQRLAGRPIAYIIGSKEFYGRSFYVDERVLIPRPDTEILVETVLKAIEDGVVSSEDSIIDVGTGSGAVGITLAAELDCMVLLSDISCDALDVARINSRRILGRELETIASDLLPLGRKYGIIVSNPPYLTDEWVAAVDQNVRSEPDLALRGFGEDGLDIIRALVAESSNHGSLFIECDYRQAKQVAGLFEEHGFTNISIQRDLQGLERVVWGVRT
ncbi:MAG TPA: peptide chain release factor N(5)-glutamine methyltransferase [Sphaerochaeta sp.]|nr:peptide chain release factor N(5)-glutamine methyltransferase [Sphaerochaeta sp.]HPK64137.1 peptide chain release factor N(5)-glutamine methyltransferase [Sphaerochaeta sp.]